MRLKKTLVLIAATALVVLVLAICLIFADTKSARWLYDDGGRTSEPLLKRAAPAWSLDVKRYKYVGVHSTRGGVIVHRWEHRDAQQAEVVDVTSEEGLVCYSKRDNKMGQYQNMGCLQYPE